MSFSFTSLLSQPKTAAFSAAILLASTAIAATPEEDQLRRQQERERILREQQESRPDVRLERLPVAPPLDGIPTNESPCFQVNQILLTGEGSADFQWLLKHASLPGEPLLGRCLGAQGINVVMGRMQNALVAAGYVTSRVLASPQDLKAGQLNLTLMLGRVGQLRLIDPQGHRATLRNALPLRPGDVLNLRGIEQGLENLKRVPSADADIQIAPAEGKDAQPGESDLLVRWRQSSPFRLALTVDDAGSKSTGKYMGSATVSYDHWWTLNDLFYVSATRSLGGGDEGKRGNKSHTVHYSVPWGYWLFGLTTSQHRYHQSVAGDSVDYVYSGTSANQEISLSRLLYRDGVSKVQTSLRGWKRESANFINDAEVGVQRRRTGGWEWGLNYRRYMGRASLDINTSVKRGTGANRSLSAPEEQDGEGTSRPFIVFANAQLNVPFHLNEQAL
ncbi:ShlB/FhaC/HecB family hemolysin secretion/activation protein, partial [Chitinimonas sp. BJB300]|uniref:ShlB/FhaC/HecB family hemolysin secretion/activation protein n=2 Tax=Chitinimonas sp. BJB300 TaxID=1559339 RepID=UPI001E5D5F6C